VFQQVVKISVPILTLSLVRIDDDRSTVALAGVYSHDTAINELILQFVDMLETDQ